MVEKRIEQFQVELIHIWNAINAQESLLKESLRQFNLHRKTCTTEPDPPKDSSTSPVTDSETSSSVDSSDSNLRDEGVTADMLKDMLFKHTTGQIKIKHWSISFDRIPPPS